MKQFDLLDQPPLTGPKLQSWLVETALRESGRTLALENVVQWLVFRLLRQSDRPAELKDELARHVQVQIDMTTRYADQHGAAGDGHKAAEAANAIQALSELLESLDASVAIDRGDA